MWNVLNYSSSFYFIIAKRPSKELIIDGFDYTKICVEFFSDRPAQPQDSFACNVANKHTDEHNYDDLTFLDLPHFKHVPETIKKITPSNIEEALATPKFAVQLAAVQSGLMTKEQIKKLINGHYLDLIKKNFSDTYAERVSHNYESLVVKAESIYF
jgi:hypothetical protein